MTDLIIRVATHDDIPALAQIRGSLSGYKELWHDRISAYMNCTHHPQHALRPRIIYVAIVDGTIVGFIAGHLTQRFDCDGELQWINVIENFARKGIASKLVKNLATWFATQHASRICVDPGDDKARLFYAANGAKSLDPHWMYWPDIKSII